MSKWKRFFYYLLDLPLKLLVKNETIPTDPINDLNIDFDNNINIFVLPYSSKADLLVIRRSCLEFGKKDIFDENIIGETKLPRFVFIHKTKKKKSSSVLLKYLKLLEENKNLEVQMIPVSVLFGRKPKKEGKKIFKLRAMTSLQKIIAILKSGRDCFVNYSKPVSLRFIADNLGTDLSIANKLNRVAGIHFSRQRTAAIGPQLPIRKNMINRLLNSPNIKKAIEEEAKSKNISLKKAEKNAHVMFDEIAADFNYRALRVSDYILTWMWNRLYQGLKITNNERIRNYAEEGYEIIYAPCHRSHMDYLLLSYVLYRKGFVPPHIAAGINLNFWPAGPIFRRLGAFFLRRTFSGNKLYTAVFREYLSELFMRGYSVEYFIEGGRSRTGRSLKPKTGTLSITVQSMLKNNMRPIIIVPVYIGYEHIMELNSYTKELRGHKKEKESFWLTIKGLKNLKNLGFGYINFGDPINLANFLNQSEPNWREFIDNDERPNWLNNTVNHLAENLIQQINSAAVINPINLCSTIILSSNYNAITKENLLEQIRFYLDLFKSVPYSNEFEFPNQSAEEIFENSKATKKFLIEKDQAGEIIRFSRKEAIKMTYYRNNIQHLIIIPALITQIVSSFSKISRKKLIEIIQNIFPILKSEFFLYFNSNELIDYTNKIIDFFIQNKYFLIENKFISANKQFYISLKMFSSNSSETLERYFIFISLLNKDPLISRPTLENKSRLIAERLSILHGFNSPEFFDKSLFSNLVNSFKQNQFLDENNKELINKFYLNIKKIINKDIERVIDNIDISN